MPVKVRNNESSTVVFAKPLGGESVKITWGPKGQPNDTQRCPDAITEDTDFLNSLDAGIFEVVSGPADVLERLRAEANDVRTDREAQRAAAEAKQAQILDRRQDRDILSQTCIGPAPTGRSGLCGRAVLVRNANRDQTPPLCAQHAGLADQYYLHEAGSRGEGATESREGVVRREWKRIEMAQPRTL